MKAEGHFVRQLILQTHTVTHPHTPDTTALRDPPNSR